MTNRRSILFGLATLPAATLPAMASVTSNADAAIIAQANKVVLLVQAEFAAMEAHGLACERFDVVKPSKPHAAYYDDAARAAWEAERAALACQTGHKAAERRWHRAVRRLKAGSRQLETMTPTTPAGLRSKIAATVAVFDNYKDCAPSEWLADLAESALRNSLTIGEA